MFVLVWLVKSHCVSKKYIFEIFHIFMSPTMRGFVPGLVSSDSETYLCVLDDFRDIWDILCFYRKPKFNSELKLENYVIFYICDWVQVNIPKMELNFEIRGQLDWRTLGTEAGLVWHDSHTKQGVACEPWAPHANLPSLPAFDPRHSHGTCLIHFVFEFSKRFYCMH